MPKAKWGSGDEALTAADIDGAQSNQQYTPYSGPVPPAGLYRFAIKMMKQGTSGTGNDKLMIVMELDGSWKEAHAKYDGYPLFDHMPVMKSTAFRQKALNEAIGATGKDFLSMLVDEDKKVTKYGSVGDPSGLLVYVNCSRRKPTDQYPEASLQLNGTGYLPIDDAPDDDDEPQADTDASDDADDDEPPF